MKLRSLTIGSSILIAASVLFSSNAQACWSDYYCTQDGSRLSADVIRDRNKSRSTYKPIYPKKKKQQTYYNYNNYNNYYGAIAYNELTGLTAASWNHRSSAEANLGALQECGFNCKIAITVVNACAAIARGASGNFGVAWGSSSSDAAQKAVIACNTHDLICISQQWLCSTGN